MYRFACILPMAMPTHTRTTHTLEAVVSAPKIGKAYFQRSRA